MRKIKISFIGVGFFSQISHIINYYRNPNVELYEICDLDQKLAIGVKKRFGFTGKVFSDYKKMSINKTDGFVIIVQRRLTTNIANFFLKKGCNIFTEKPHTYSVRDYKISKLLQKGVWLKGYVRRSDKAVRYLKNNFEKYQKKLGKLISINFEAKNGNSYLGLKHYIKPKIGKLIKSKKSSFPQFILKKNKKKYDENLNSACHSIDIFDYFEFQNIRKIFPIISEKEFSVLFSATYKNNEIPARINLSSSKVKNWHEKMEFLFEYGQIEIKFNAPLFKKKSHGVIIKNSFSKYKKLIEFKNKWSFDLQTKRFIELIKNRIKRKKQDQDSKSGLNSIIFYENIWKKYQKMKNN